MPAFAAVITRASGRWTAHEERVDDCESVGELADLLAEYDGSVRLLVIEQDDEYAAIVRLEDDVRVFLSDGHAADNYPLAALLAEDLGPAVGTPGEADDVDVADLGLEDADPVVADVVSNVPPVHDSVPFGDPAIVDDLGTDPADLVAMCVHPGTLPIDVLVAVCEKAGCADVFDDLRG